MRLLVTGGLGYVGGRFAVARARETADELCLGSRREAGSPDWLPQATVVQMRWHSSSALEESCRGFDGVVHLAAMNAHACAADPVQALEVNGVATARLLAAAVRAGVRRFVYVSTAHVYDSILSGTITEATVPVSLHPYATSHRAAEDVVRAAHHRGDVAGIVVRLSNAYGAPVDVDVDCWMLLINDLCRQAVTGRRMALRSDGTQRRNFVPMSDVCRAIGHVLDLPAVKLASGPMNLGGAWSPTIWDVACLVRDRCEAVLGFRPELTRTPPGAAPTTALDYRSDLLRDSGFLPGEDRLSEIDRLLELCNVSFG